MLLTSFLLENLFRKRALLSWLTLDTQKTIGVGVTERLYIFAYDTEEIVPPAQVDSFRIGA